MKKIINIIMIVLLAFFIVACEKDVNTITSSETIVNQTDSDDSSSSLDIFPATSMDATKEESQVTMAEDLKNYSIISDVELFRDVILSNLGRADVTYEEYRVDCIFNFGGFHLKTESFAEKEHSEGYEDAHFVLGGIGQCIDPEYKTRTEYTDGKLTDYKWMDNHSSETKILVFEADRWSGCLYKYSFDINKRGDTTEYWVVFCSTDESVEPYVVFLSADEFTEEEILRVVEFN